LVQPFSHREAPLTCGREGGEGPDLPIPGVRSLDHTADVGLRVEAEDLPALFVRAGLGTLWLVLERSVAGPYQDPPSVTSPEVRQVELVEPDLAGLLRSWLRTLLFWEDSDGFVTTGARIAVLPVPFCGSPDGHAFGVQGTVQGHRDSGPRVREIKGVTFHGLSLERVGPLWEGQVIFDV